MISTRDKNDRLGVDQALLNYFVPLYNITFSNAGINILLISIPNNDNCEELTWKQSWRDQFKDRD